VDTQFEAGEIFIWNSARHRTMNAAESSRSRFTRGEKQKRFFVNNLVSWAWASAGEYDSCQGVEILNAAVGRGNGARKVTLSTSGF